MAKFARTMLVSLAMLGVVATQAGTALASSVYNAPAQFAGKSRTVTVTDSLAGKVDFGTKFSSVDQVCFDFTFTGDLLDPADELDITLGNGKTARTWGFFNPTSSAQSTRTLCLVAQYQPEAMAMFLDGQERIVLKMWSGSVQVESLNVSLTGTV